MEIVEHNITNNIFFNDVFILQKGRLTAFQNRKLQKSNFVRPVVKQPVKQRKG